jgi:7,8-dihydro-6-hydroxymethylpterin-pyrophosphokinase
VVSIHKGHTGELYVTPPVEPESQKRFANGQAKETWEERPNFLWLRLNCLDRNEVNPKSRG